MKKTLALIVTAALLLPSFAGITAFAGDYDNHWAKSYIDYLKLNDIVSGDANGNMRPDGFITRAEFAQSTNKAFGYTDAGSKRFPDVSESEWYYNAMNIAYEKGYFQGDEYGNGNPVKPISRAEAATAFARIINAASSEAQTGFSDDSEIPVWARPAVKALSDAEIISGYTDGSYKPYNNMKRGEYFTVLAKYVADVRKDPVGGEDKYPGVTQDGYNTQLPVVSGGSGGGGGGGAGGGGGGYTPGTVVTAISNVSYNTSNGNLSWSEIGNASYEVVVTRKSTSASETISGITANSCNIATAIQTLLESGTRAEAEEFTVTITANTSSGTVSKTETVTVTTPFVEIPNIQYDQTIAADGTEEIKLYWTPSDYAAAYTLAVDFGTGYESLSITGTDSVNEAVLSAEQISKITGKEVLKISIDSNDADYLSVTDAEIPYSLPLFAGEAGGAKLISNARHFNNIVKAQGETFELINDLSLDNHKPLTVLGGLTLDGKGYTVNVDVNQSASNAAIFAQLSGTVKIKNMVIEGSIYGADYSAALVGQITYSSGFNILIENITNNADISGTTRIGGIVGEAYSSYIDSSNLLISKCINNGNVTGRSGNTSGGIVGLTGGAVDLCANTGDITSSNIAGGISGQGYGSVTNCYNTGTVDGKSGSAGGIIGNAATGSAVENLYNIGEVIVSNGRADVNIGGIAGTDASGRMYKNCYNLYTGFPINPQPNVNIGIVGKLAASTSFNNCYTLDVEGDISADRAGITELTLDKFTDIANLNFSGNIWKVDPAGTGYKYPQLIELPHYTEPVPYTAPVLAETPANPGTVNMTIKFDGDDSASKIRISIKEKDTDTYLLQETEYGLTDGNYELTLQTSSFTVGTTYVISAYHPSDSSFTLDSAKLEYEYTHEAYKLPAAKINSVLWSASGSDEVYTVSVDLTKEDPLFKSYRITLYKADKATEAAAAETVTPVSGTTAEYTITADSTLLAENTLYLKIEALGDDPAITNTPAAADYTAVDVRFGGTQTVTEDDTDIVYNIIGNARHLGNINLNVSGNYMLSDNIAAASDYTAPVNFAGILNGNGKEVTLYSDKGLIESTTASSVIKNLTVAGEIKYEVNVSSGTRIQLGGIVGINKGKITNCVNNAVIYNSAQGVGGIAGQNDATGSITYCYNYGSVDGKTTYAGGICGLNFGSITSCGNHGIIGANAQSSTKGGIAGLHQAPNYPMQYCYNIGTVYGNANIGGLAGSTASAGNDFINCYNAGDVIMTSATQATYGGINGYCASGEDYIDKCYNAGRIGAGSVANGITTDNSAAKAIFGSFNTSRTAPVITSCYFLGTASDVGETGTSPLTEDEMKSAGSFSGWDFTDVWEMGTGAYLYPVLKNITLN